ncbi:murein transglycosylase A [Facilibium subflavum]|uniref:murein transglycosylase A n=1 Tax=Facilibium subflavum TaxID=2219058 RepID=UPI000E648C61|nr:murein transglycosylase A [Facilibium subflavum]
MAKKIIPSIATAVLLSTSLYTFAVANVSYKPITYQALPQWNNGQQLYAYKALKTSCQSIINSKNYSPNWINTCQNLLSAPVQTNHQARKILQTYFTPYLISYNDQTKGVFTGYYEPLIKGSLHRNKDYPIPIYKKPADLISKVINGKRRYGHIVNGQFKPYYTRQEIADNNFFTQKDVIAWVPSRIERTFLQIQGSGRILLENGSSLLVGYAAQNGQPYRPIGRYLLEHKLMPREKISMQSIKKWLKDHPKEADTVLNYDPSFVFFKVLKHKNPIGAQGVPLTPGYSIAVDSDFHQYGTPVWLSTTYDTPTDKNQKLNRLFIAQDTGGAINGAIRGDVFWGNGKLAEFYAGHMNHLGEMFVLLPNFS